MCLFFCQGLSGAPGQKGDPGTPGEKVSFLMKFAQVFEWNSQMHWNILIVEMFSVCFCFCSGSDRCERSLWVGRKVRCWREHGRIWWKRRQGSTWTCCGYHFLFYSKWSLWRNIFILFILMFYGYHRARQEQKGHQVQMVQLDYR